MPSTLILPANVRSVPAKPIAARPQRIVQANRVPSQAGSSGRGIAADPFGEIGTSGLRQYGGFVLEEWLTKLRGRYGAWAYREMMDNSPIAGGIIFSVKMLAKQCEWRVEDDVEGDFVESCMHDMSHTWGDFVSEALSMLGYGWALHEEVFKRRRGGDALPEAWDESEESRGFTLDEEPDPTPPSSKYNDGRIGWRRLPVRAQETLMRWHFRDYSSLRAMEQIDWHGGKHIIPIGKALLFRTETTRQNPEGRSLLRNAWTSYYAIQNIQGIEAIGIERDLAGIPVATPPEGVDLNAPENVELYNAVKELVIGIRRDEDEGVVLPSADWKLELLTTGGSRQIDTDKVIRRYENRMTTSVLADFLMIGQDSVGSYAMVDVKSELFGVAIDAILDLLCEVMNRYAIPRLLSLNGMKPAKLPKIAHSSAGRIDLRVVGEFLTNLSIAGAPIPWTEKLMEHLFRAGALPAPEFDGPKLPVAQPSPAAHDSQWRPAWGDENKTTGPVPPAPPTEREALSKSEQQTGAMVALYPAPAIARTLAQAGGEAPEELHLTLAFLGDASAVDDPERLRKVVEGWAASTPPLEAHMAGTGIFTHGPESVLYASPDSPALPHARQRLVDALEHAGFPPDGGHGFTPHVTLAYGHDGAPPSIAAVPFIFDQVSVVIAGARTDYPLAPDAVAKADTDTLIGETVNIAPILEERARILSYQLEREIESALDGLGQQAGSAYSGMAQKSMSPRELQRTVGQVMANSKVGSWVRDRLTPILRNHAARVIGDTSRVVGQQAQQPVSIGNSEVKRIEGTAGQRLKIRDIEPQVRESITNAILAGNAAGEHPMKIAARIRDSVPKGRFTHAGSPWRAQLIARDQTANLQRESTLSAYDAMRNVGHVEVRDGIYGPPRSDAQCIHRAGQIVTVAEAKLAVHAYHPLCTLGFNPVVTVDA
jgi:2'-5' RNA ligase